MPPIHNKPAHPQTPQGPHQPANPTAEQLQHLKDIDEALQRPEDSQAPESMPQEAPTDSSDDAAAQRSRQTETGRDASRTRDGAEKKSAYRHDVNETRGSQLPQQMGRPKLDLTPLLQRGDSAPEKGVHPHEGGLRQSPEPGAPDREFVRPDRPMPGQPTRSQYRSVSQDKAFQGPMNGSPLHQKMQAKTLEQNRKEQTTGERQASEEVLKRGEVGQLFRMRHKFEKKDDAGKVLRYELAKARQEAKEKVKALKYQNEGGGHKEDANRLALRTARVAKEGDALKERLSEKLKTTAGESAFEQVLQQVLDGGESVPDLPESVRARFTAKTEAEWEEFFKNALSLQSSEIESEGQLDKLVEALFRGLYRRGADGKMMLVSDLTFAGEAGADPAEYKFSRIALNDPELLSLLEKLKPGNVIDKELLKKIGDQFLFTQLLHVVDQLAVSEEQKKAILKEFRQQVSSSSRLGLEKALAKRRERDTNAGIPTPSAAYAGDPFHKKERHIGPPKFLMYMVYGVLTVTVAMILFILFRQAF